MKAAEISTKTIDANEIFDADESTHLFPVGERVRRDVHELDLRTGHGHGAWVADMRDALVSQDDGRRVQNQARFCERERSHAVRMSAARVLVVATCFLRRRTDEKHDITTVLEIVERRVEVAVALVERIGKRSTEYFSSCHDNLERRGDL